MRGTLLFLWLIGGSVLVAGCGRLAQPRSNDQVILHQIHTQDASLPLTDRIKEVEELVDKLASRQSRDEAKIQLAVLYRELGRKRAAEGNPVEAESCLNRAHELDPRNAICLSSLGKLYADQAARAGDPDARIRMWERASKNWRDAANLEPDKVKQKAYNTGAAEALYSCAKELAGAGRKQAALEHLYDARLLVPPDSDVANAMKQFLRQLQP